jgi:type II secretory pathway component GspD/PulD (secretin)
MRQLGYTIGRAALLLLLVCALVSPVFSQGQPPAPRKPKLEDTAQKPVIYEKSTITNGDGSQSVIFQVDEKDDLAELQKILNEFLPGKPPEKAAALKIFPKYRLMIYRGAPEAVEHFRSVIRALAARIPQVKVDVTIAEITTSMDFQFGFEGSYDLPAGGETLFRGVETNFNPTDFIKSTLPGSNTDFIGSTFSLMSSSSTRGVLDTEIRMLQEDGRAEILSNPNITVHSGQAAEFFSGDEVPYAEARFVGNNANLQIDTKFVKPGIRLIVVPHVLGDNVVNVDLFAEVSTVSGFTVLQQGTEAPNLIRRYAITNVTVRSGEEIVIGGLKRKETTKRERGIPIVKDIPIFGWLFKRIEENEIDTEILFVLTPQVLADGARSDKLVTPKFFWKDDPKDSEKEPGDTPEDKDGK